MKTIRKMSFRIDMVPLWMLPIVAKMAPGRPTTMPPKMINEIPLPTPRSVICSPNHMTKAVPVVNVSTVMKRKPHPGLGTSVPPPGVVMRSSHNEMVMPWIMEIPMVR